MRCPSLRVAALALLATDSLVAAEESVLKGFSVAAIRGDGFLALPVGTVQRPAGQKRADKAFEDRLYNMEVFYATDVDIGNPPQKVMVLVDTGSSELWVNPDCRTAKSRQQAQQCVKFGKYDPSKSSQSYGPFGKEQLSYGDPSDKSTQTSATIFYYADTVSLGGAGISNQTFGVVSQSKGQSQGILGLAPDLKGGFKGDVPYSLVLGSMASQGIIASRVYALDLRHSDSQYGAVIYGGFDKSKYIGALEKRPLVRGIGGEFRLAVELTTVGVTTASSSNFKVAGSDANVMLDSGTTISRMHSAVAMPILQALGAQNDGEGYYQVACSLRSSGGSVDFGFGNKTIRVPLKDFILNLTSSSSSCYVGMVITTDQQILGDSVLRAGYFIFDWDNQEVHIAQAANCGNNDIVAVSSGKGAVPSVTGNCKESDAVFTGGTPTKGSVATKAYTTVYTITSCPSFDSNCRVGVVTTQSVAAATVTGKTDDNAGTRATATNCLVAIFGVFAIISNAL
ncbi:uncharacterized protein UV8b_04077 [Ustilaginoidea virens]|uniref:Peptidase A1 domain-containing protein n=1 Tax=Ustilaginoidea virens TaxID=1159556 RepID=A0A8E5MHM7_USTVR|nr:uncharacterized protein UV8b_04077 [Ustilaginoidea virens]QUC19836.1 hypothetical protein UV8b_04077 [Ustilaginoidea virens]